MIRFDLSPKGQEAIAVFEFRFVGHIKRSHGQQINLISLFL